MSFLRFSISSSNALKTCFNCPDIELTAPTTSCNSSVDGIAISAWNFRSETSRACLAKHARDVSERKFHAEMAMPSTLELQEVVGAVNSMSGQLKHVFNALDEEIENLKKDTLWDEVSQLPNRLYFTGQVNSWLSELT